MSRSNHSMHCISLSALFLTVLAIYAAVILLTFQSTLWPHSSLLRQLLSPLHSAVPAPSQHIDAPSHHPAAAVAAAHTIQQPQTHLNIVPLSVHREADYAVPSPPSAADAAPPAPAPAAADSPAAATIAVPSTRMNDLPASSSFVPPAPTRNCTSIELRIHKERIYALQYAAIDTADWGVALNVTVFQVCLRPPDKRVRVTFRVHTSGHALATVPGVQLREGEWHTSALLRLPDAGLYTLRCKLQMSNASADMEARDWPPRFAIQFSDIPGQMWLDRDILASPVTDLAVPPSSHARHRPLNHTQLQSTPPSALPLPLCWAHAGSPALDGRWVLGPRHEHISHQWASTSVFDDYAAVYAPYDCSIDYTARILPALHSLRWLHLVGDSNVRALFVQLCDVAGGSMHSGDPKLGGWDLPRLCTLKRDVDGSGALTDNATVITYHNWFHVKKLPLDNAMTFSSFCARYTEDTKQIERDGMVYGWPECAHTHSSVYQLSQPALTYFGWGNHQAEMGASAATRAYMRDTLFAHDYWRGRHALVALTEDLDPSRLAGHWAPHFAFRNNPRVRAVNEMMTDTVRECMAAGLMLDGQPVGGGGGGGGEERGWLPVFDAFSVTHAGSEVLHGDTVHFWPDLERELVRLLAHYITHAPQLPMARQRLATQQG